MITKDNKGFTLVELLAVIVILALIALITVPNILKTINNSKGKLETVQEETLKDACKNYVAGHTGEIEDTGTCVTLDTLYQAGFLESNAYSNPKGGTYGANSGFLVKWDDSINQYTYTYQPSC